MGTQGHTDTDTHTHTQAYWTHTRTVSSHLPFVTLLRHGNTTLNILPPLQLRGNKSPEIKFYTVDKWTSANYLIYLTRQALSSREGNGTPLQYSCLENPMDGGAWWAAVHGIMKSWTQLSDLTFTFHSHTLEKEMATHSSVLAWRIPGTEEPGGLPSTGSHRVGHD